MVNEVKYSTALTGAGFMMYEFKQMALLKLENLSDKEIRTKVIDENLFQYNKTSSLIRAFPYLLKRVNALDTKLLTMVANEDIQTAKIINLYGIMKSDQLFNEFMNEVVQEKLEHVGELLEKKDINLFFRYKAEQSDFLNNLAESTLARLKNQFARILIEAGILRDLKTKELQRVFIDDQLKSYLTSIGDKQYVRAMGES